MLEVHLSDIGIKLNNNCRILKSRELLKSLIRQESHKMAKSEHELLRMILASYKDVIQWSAIARYCKSSADKLYVDKSLLLLKDAVSPAYDNQLPTPGRDVQFELFANACWNAAGATACLAGPPAPDLLINTFMGQFGAEAKRIKSVKQLKSRAREAGKQLRHCPEGGLFLTDLSTVFEEPTVHDSIEQALQSLEERLYNFMFGNLTLVKAAVKSSRWCFAWTAYAQAPCFLRAGPPAQVFQWKTFNLCAENDPRWLHIVEFTSSLARFQT